MFLGVDNLILVLFSYNFGYGVDQDKKEAGKKYFCMLYLIRKINIYLFQ